jgi:hypothetical protein
MRLRYSQEDKVVTIMASKSRTRKNKDPGLGLKSATSFTAEFRLGLHFNGQTITRSFKLKIRLTLVNYFDGTRSEELAVMSMPRKSNSFVTMAIRVGKFAVGLDGTMSSASHP